MNRILEVYNLKEQDRDPRCHWSTPAPVRRVTKRAYGSVKDNNDCIDAKLGTGGFARPAVLDFSLKQVTCTESQPTTTESQRTTSDVHRLLSSVVLRPIA